jgi:hypothetical protein
MVYPYSDEICIEPSIWNVKYQNSECLFLFLDPKIITVKFH